MKMADGLPGGVGDFVRVRAEDERHKLGYCTQIYNSCTESQRSASYILCYPRARVHVVT